MHGLQLLQTIGHQHQEQLGKVGRHSWVVLRSQVRRAAPDYSDELLTGRWFQFRASSQFAVTRGSLT